MTQPCLGEHGLCDKPAVVSVVRGLAVFAVRTLNGRPAQGGVTFCGEHAEHELADYLDRLPR